MLSSLKAWSFRLLPGSDDRPADVLLPALLSILFNNNLMEVIREEEKGVQHAFNIKMGKYSDRCKAEDILFSWRL